MEFSHRVQNISESMTLQLNAKATQMAAEGKKIYNLTAGQLPFPPIEEFRELIRRESHSLRSFQYSPVSGYPKLRRKIISHFEKARGVELSKIGDFDAVISNGAKHSLMSIMQCLIEKGDEVIFFSPFWVSYPEMIKFCGGKGIVIKTYAQDDFAPSLEEIESKITEKTKLIVINNPNNPTGIHYSDQWMKGFADLMVKFPHIHILSDEIYDELFYDAPRPTYFYCSRPELLKRTMIVNGISKSLACTGLRIGFSLVPLSFAQVLGRLQGQTTSGANSLIQCALESFDFEKIPLFLAPIKEHLRDNAHYLRDSLLEHHLGDIWYAPRSAFYFLMDFSKTPLLRRFKSGEGEDDFSIEVCEELLHKKGLALVPGTAFGFSNGARMSLVAPRESFREAVDLLVNFLLD